MALRKKEGSSSRTNCACYAEFVIASATQDIMSASANKHRRALTYEVGDQVLVARRFFDNPRTDVLTKFHPLFVGPFKIKAKVN